MARSRPARFSGGTGGTGIPLGPRQNQFGTNATASRSAAEALRDTYATANPAWLAQYNGNRAFYIRLVWTGGAHVFQRRNVAGDGWEDVANVVPGHTGPGPTTAQLTAAVRPFARTATSDADSRRLIAEAIDAEIGNQGWRTRLSGQDLVDVMDAAIGSNEWRMFRTPGEVKAAYESNTDTNALTDALLAQIQSVADPRRLVGLLQWDLDPKIIDGGEATDFLRTFRIEFSLPYLPLTDYYYEVYIGGQLAHSRRQWSTVAHLDVAVGNTLAGTIAGAVTGEKHAEVELRFYSGAATSVAVAVTSRPILIVEADASDGSSSSGDGVTEARARDIALAATATQAHAGDPSRWPRNKLTIPDATTEDPGQVEKATDDEMSAGTVDKFPDAFEVRAFVEQAILDIPEAPLLSISPRRMKKGEAVEIRFQFSANRFPASATHVEPFLFGQSIGNRTAITQLMRDEGLIDLSRTWPANNDAVLLASYGYTSSGVSLAFYGQATGGTSIESHATGITVEREPRVLQAAVNGANNAGVTSITLPSNYTDWDHLEVGMWNGTDIVENTLPTALIAAQASGQNFLTGRDRTGAGNTRLEWNATNRTLTRNDDNRIIYAALKP